MKLGALDVEFEKIYDGAGREIIIQPRHVNMRYFINQFVCFSVRVNNGIALVHRDRQLPLPRTYSKRPHDYVGKLIQFGILSNYASGWNLTLGALS